MLPLGLPFARTAVSDEWFDWPSLPELFPMSFPGVQTGRDAFLVDTDVERLRARVADYFDARLNHEEIGRRYPRAMTTTARFDAPAVRDALLSRGGPDEAGFIPFAYRPFDNRWLYWDKDTKLLDEKRADYRPHIFDGNRWLVTQKKPRRAWSVPQVISPLGCLDLLDRGATCIPAWLLDEGLQSQVDGSRRHNLSERAKRYLDGFGATVDDLFHYVLAALYDPAYRIENAGALRMEWPRIPLPGWPNDDSRNAALAFAGSTERGRKLAALLDSEEMVAGVTHGDLSPAMACVAVPATTDDRNMASEDFAVSAGWGYFGAANAVMPGQGHVVERPFSSEERAAIGKRLPVLGATTFDVHLNDRAFWRNVPAGVWNYKLGGYQVLKKWLSYRESTVLGRSLKLEEVQHFTATARRIAAILHLTSNTGDGPE